MQSGQPMYSMLFCPNSSDTLPSAAAAPPAYSQLLLPPVLLVPAGGTPLSEVRAEVDVLLAPEANPRPSVEVGALLLEGARAR